MNIPGGLLLLLAFGACRTFSPSPSTGIEGQLLRGPVCPGPIRPGQVFEVPLEATFHVLDRRGRVVKTFSTNADGQFRIALRPGAYTLVPDDTTPILRPATQQHPVVVAEHAFTQLRIVFDTGLR
jgi:hypothetical protein